MTCFYCLDRPQLVFLSGHRNRVDITAGIEVDFFFVRGLSGLRVCVRPKLLGFYVWIGVDLVSCVGIEIDLVFVSGPRKTCFFRGWSKVTWCWYAGRKSLDSNIKIGFV